MYGDIELCMEEDSIDDSDIPARICAFSIQISFMFCLVDAYLCFKYLSISEKNP